MGAKLPLLEKPEFESRLLGCSPIELSDDAVRKLWLHYQELVRWNPTVSLVGPGTADEIVERHYGESLAAVPCLDPQWRVVVDVGSGGGFPGVVLSAVVPKLEVVLVESRERKCVFLDTVIRKAALPCYCLGARVGVTPPEGLPPKIDLVTSRAVNLSPSALEGLSSRMSARGGAFFWVGAEAPNLPEMWAETGRIELPGSLSRSIMRVRVRAE
ncbi:MAG: RsmG family class I SAM-dependent methyltransferase [Thermoanaerobaculia bacterium]